MRTLANVLPCLACVGISTPAPAAVPSNERSEPLPQTLSQALRSYGQRSGQQIIFTEEVVAGLTTASLRGPLTTGSDLPRLLEGTGLVAELSPSGTWMIRRQRPDDSLISKADDNSALLLVRVSQSPPATGPGSTAPAASPEQPVLSEVIVTATRQTSTVNRVPMSIAALTAASLEQSGVKNTEELARVLPSITFRRAGNEGNPTVAIRGIVSSIGSPATAIFLDDTPLQKRDNPGFSTGNGTPFPQIFDLVRIEVLRGPQGTLYGGSAAGGAIRFITPEPSLTRFSGVARGEVTYTEDGDPGYEGGVAVGGPLIDDKLGFRLSLWQRRTGGYLDHVSIYDGHAIDENTNSATSTAARLAVAWEPVPKLRITPALYLSREAVDDHDIFWEDVPRHTVNAGYFINRGTVNGVTFNFPDQLFPGGTYGPYDYGPHKSGAAYYLDEAGNAVSVKAPRTTRLTVPTLTIDYSFGAIDLRSITSYATDSNKGYSSPGPGIRVSAVLPTTTNAGFVSVASHTGPDLGTPVPGGAGYIPLVLPGLPQQYYHLFYDYGRDSFSEELRLSSAAGSGRLQWVAGLFFSHTDNEALTWGVNNTDAMSILVRGVPEKWFIGAPSLANGNYTQRSLATREQELAAFGEVNFALTERLKVIAGLRVARHKVELNQAAGGSPAGTPPGFVGAPAAPAVLTSIDQPHHAFADQPGDDPFVRFSGTQKGTPVNPKVGLSWQATERNLLYATLAKGYRGGGINQPANPVSCASDLGALGLTGAGTPLIYESDSVWSYEAGAKLRLLGNRAQINASVYYIDWKDPQLAVRLLCGLTYVTNAGAAASRGFDVQGQINLVGKLTLESSIAYTEAEYTRTFAIQRPNNTQSIVVAKGDSLGVPKWQATMGAQYAFSFARGAYPAYARAEYQYAGTYERGVGPGRVGYDPLLFAGDATHFLTARAGVTIGTWDFALFGNNLTSSQDRLSEGHQTGFALVTGSTFRPKEYGLQANYRF